jgi:AdoMet-dependent heme synthase
MNIQVNKPRNFAIQKCAERISGKLLLRDINFELTEHCNLKCIHCCFDDIGSKRTITEMTLSEIAGVLDKLFQAGVFGITFTGGEPLCRPDFLDILGYAYRRGFFFGLKTNGTLLTTAIAEKIKKMGITSVHVSLYGASPEIHEQVTRVAGSYEKTIESIKILKSYKIPVAIRTTIMTHNFKENADMVVLAEKLGAHYHPDPLIFPKFGQPGSVDNIRIDDYDLCQLIKQGNWVNIDNGILFKNADNHLLCSAGRSRCGISPQGDVFPCPLWRIPLGNLSRQTFNEVWNCNTAQSVRSIVAENYPVCVECEFLKYCSRCPGLAYSENSGISGPSLENCRLARAIKGVIDDEQKNLPET